MMYRAFSLTWPASMQIYGNKWTRLHKKRVQLPEDCLGTPTWPPFYCFGTPIWPPWRHMKTFCIVSSLYSFLFTALQFVQKLLLLQFQLKYWFVCLRDCLNMESVTCDHIWCIRRWEYYSISKPRFRAERQRPASTPKVYTCVLRCVEVMLRWLLWYKS